MKLINTLPEVFEEFNEQRKKSFVTALEMKEKGIPFVGAFCTYLPQEIPMAMGASVVGLCSMSGETIPEAEKDLPRNLCPLVKSSYGFAKTDKCPYFYFSDLIVGETTCDGKNSEIARLGEFKPVYVMELPNSQSPDALELWKKEVIKFKEKLESHFGVTITDEQVRQAARIKNAERAALREFYELMKLKPAPMLGQDLYKVLYGATFKFDKEAIPGEVHALVERIKAEYEAGRRGQPACQAGRTAAYSRHWQPHWRCDGKGHPCTRGQWCTGRRVRELQRRQSSRRGCRRGCAGYLRGSGTPLSQHRLLVHDAHPNRIKLMGCLIDEYQVDAVVDVILQACHTYNVESYKIRRFVTEEKGIPYLSLETDYSTSDVGQLNTRMAAFVEML